MDGNLMLLPTKSASVQIPFNLEVNLATINHDDVKEVQKFSLIYQLYRISEKSGETIVD